LLFLPFGLLFSLRAKGNGARGTGTFGGGSGGGGGFGRTSGQPNTGGGGGGVSEFNFGGVGNGGSGIFILSLSTPEIATFSYTGTIQDYVVPAWVSQVRVSMWGAGGGGRSVLKGGAGAFMRGVLPVTPGETLGILVGQGGRFAFRGSGKTFGGGGTGGGTGQLNLNAQGGGRSAIRRGTSDIATVGAGGGSRASGGGRGGIVSGQNALAGSAQGGTQTAGGRGADSTSPPNAGSLNTGGDTGRDNASGGGSGFYGGGGGGQDTDGAGGSSLYTNFTTFYGEESPDRFSAPGRGDPYYTGNVASGGADDTTGQAGHGLVVLELIGDPTALGGLATDTNNNLVLSANFDIVVSSSNAEVVRFTPSNTRFARDVDMSGNVLSNTLRYNVGGYGSLNVASAIPGVGLWLDAADSATITFGTGSNIAQWNDKSGNSRHVYQSTGSAQPTLLSGALNTRPVVSFNAGLSLSNGINTFAVSNLSNLTIYAVTSLGRVIQWAESGGWGGVIMRVFQTLGRVRFGTGVSSRADFGEEWGVDLGTSYNLVRTSFTSGVGVIDLNATQSSISNFPVTSIRNTSNTFVVGGSLTGSVASTDNIAELIVISNALTSTQRQQVEGYLVWKWGIESKLPVGHPYRSVPVPTTLNSLADMTIDSLLNLSVASSNNLILNPTLNVGIGTSVPRSYNAYTALDVAGAIYGRVPLTIIAGTSLDIATNPDLSANSYFYITNSGFSNLVAPASSYVTTARGGQFYSLKNTTSSYLSVTVTNNLNILSPISIPPSNNVTLVISPLSNQQLLLM
jgi:hypothetical protein